MQALPKRNNDIESVSLLLCWKSLLMINPVFPFSVQEDEEEERRRHERRIERIEPVGRADSSLEHSPAFSLE